MPTDLRSQVSRLVLILSISTSVCSCASDPFQPLADALLGPKDGRTNNSETAGTARIPQPMSSGESCNRTSAIVSTDVDTAYARVMSRLRFRTLDERKRFAEKNSIGLIDEGFRHTAQPGSYYRLADLVRWNEPGGRREAAWLEVELSRDGANRTRFQGTYCLSPGDPHYADQPFRASLERRLRDSVK
jgi:hypothetical protein